MLIAAVEHSHKVVWGVGPDQQAAYEDALNELASKTPGLKWDKLDYCHLKQGADLTGDGYWLYALNITEPDDQSDQIGLFL